MLTAENILITLAILFGGLLAAWVYSTTQGLIVYKRLNDRRYANLEHEVIDLMQRVSVAESNLKMLDRRTQIRHMAVVKSEKDH